ncbi:FkbM family methyltransferase [Cesiribacter andamanensis]|uniref:Methyltransferase, FkbM family n=1 Tax=Cesiribacter andamanensis AMV16 TaxID=1279009 RepID=M7N8V9_9BACT|nr:FkbM family methyltransferase [Cesiribacter andamanensis]EMR03692.1 methyltransferase, FkbM family [Cesiribacter andamanensis AMV16]
MTKHKFYSQYGQDQYIYQKFFKGQESGFFIEIGANDGITYSNTYFFEKECGWNGLCIEPHPSAYAKLEQNRNCLTMNICVSNKVGINEFLKIEGYAEMLSGLNEKYDDAHIERINNSIQIHGGKKDIIEIPCKRLDQILDENNISKVDFCSIDTEGGELEIIESADLHYRDINVFTIENNYFGDDLKKMMAKYGYKQVNKLVCDEIYVRKRKRFWFFI